MVARKPISTDFARLPRLMYHAPSEGVEKVGAGCSWNTPEPGITGGSVLVPLQGTVFWFGLYPGAAKKGGVKLVCRRLLRVKLVHCPLFIPYSEYQELRD